MSVLTSFNEIKSAEYVPGERIDEITVKIIKLYNAQDTKNSRLCRAIISNDEGWYCTLNAWKDSADVMEAALKVDGVKSFKIKLCNKIFYRFLNCQWSV